MVKKLILPAMTLILLLLGCTNSTQEVKKNTDDIREISVVIEEGKVINHDRNIIVRKEENIRLVFTSDQSLAVHLHGYDIEKQIVAHDTATIEFNAKATGRFVITSHSSDGMHADHSGHESHLSDHAALFESDILQIGDVFEYNIPVDMKEGTIPFHDHMSHDAVGLIKIVPEVANNAPSVISVSDDHHVFEPSEVTVKPGTTIRWEIDTENKVRITSGNPPTTGHGTHGTHGTHEDEEKTLVTLEVRP